MELVSITEMTPIMVERRLRDALADVGDSLEKQQRMARVTFSWCLFFTVRVFD